MTYHRKFWEFDCWCRRPSLACLPLLVVASMLSTLYFACTASFGQTGEGSTIFSDKCAGCHSIGGGDLVGPDLARSKYADTEDLRADVKRMEANTGPLADKEVDALVEYLKSAKPGKSALSSSKESQNSQSAPTTADMLNSDKPPTSSGSQMPTEPASALRGRRLFFGDEALKNSGLSCIACHSIDGSGGNMGPDLTAIGEKMPAPALVSACEHTPYKVMKAAYREHPVLHQEALDLQAFLSSLKEPHEKVKKPPVALLGFSLSGLVLVSIAVGYRSRKKSARSMLRRRD